MVMATGNAAFFLFFNNIFSPATSPNTAAERSLSKYIIETNSQSVEHTIRQFAFPGGSTRDERSASWEQMTVSISKQ